MRLSWLFRRRGRKEAPPGSTGPSSASPRPLSPQPPPALAAATSPLATEGGSQSEQQQEGLLPPPQPQPQAWCSPPTTSPASDNEPEYAFAAGAGGSAATAAAPPPTATLVHALTRQELRALYVVVEEDGSARVQQTERRSKKGKVASSAASASAAAAAEACGGDAKTILQALAALIRALGKPQPLAAAAAATTTSTPKAASRTASPVVPSPSSAAGSGAGGSGSKRKVPVESRVLMEGLRALLALPCGCEARLRAVVFRALRYLFWAGSPQATLAAFDRLRLDVFVVRALERRDDDGGGHHGAVDEADDGPAGAAAAAAEEAMLALEKLEALKLLRCFFAHYQPREEAEEGEELGAASAATLLMSLVAVGGHKEDGEDVNFRKLCLETLREIAVSHTALAAACDGFKPLAKAVLDGALQQDLAEPILLTFLHLADSPNARRHWHPFLEIQAVLSPFTSLDMGEPSPERAALLESSRRALLVLLRTWPGVTLLASDDRRGLRAIVQGVLGDVSIDPAVRLVVFEVLEAVLRPLLSSFSAASADASASVPMAPEYGLQRAASALDMAAAAAATAGADEVSMSLSQHYSLKHRTSTLGSSRGGMLQPLPQQLLQPPLLLPPRNLLDSFLAYLLAVLVRCGLLESLTVFAIASNADASGGRAAALLVDVVRVLPSVLPADQWLALLAMPALVRMGEAAQSGGGGDDGTGLSPTDAHLLIQRAADLMHRLCRAGLAASSAPAAAAAAAAAAVGAPPMPAAVDSSYLQQQQGGPALRRPSVAEGGRDGLAATFGRLTDAENRGALVDVLALRRDVDRRYLSSSRDGDAGLGAYLDSATGRAALDERLARSRVLLGKDPGKWDWESILLLAEETLVHPARLAEALKGQGRINFLRRVLDSFRLAGAERGFFPDLPWEPANLRFLPVACALYHALALQPEGLAFLQHEPRARGALHEFAALLQHTIQHLYTGGGSNSSPYGVSPAAVSARGTPGSTTAAAAGAQRFGSPLFGASAAAAIPGTSTGGASSPTPFLALPTQAATSASTPSSYSGGGGGGPSCCLDIRTCHRTLLREYFAITGLLAASDGGRALLQASGVLPLLPKLGQAGGPLDHLARALLAHLDYGAPGALGRELLQAWLSPGSGASAGLRLFGVNLLKAQLHDSNSSGEAADGEVDPWAIDLLVGMARLGEDPAVGRAAVGVLEEVVSLGAGGSSSYRTAIAQRLPHATVAEAREQRREQAYYARMRNLFLRLLACEEGMARLGAAGWLERITRDWAFQGETAPSPTPAPPAQAGVGIAPFRYVRHVERRLMQATFAMGNEGAFAFPPPPPPPLAPTVPTAAAPPHLQPQPPAPAQAQQRQTPIIIKCDQLLGGGGGGGGSSSSRVGDLKALLSLPWQMQVQAFHETSQGVEIGHTSIELLVDTAPDAAGSFRPQDRGYAEDSDECYGQHFVRVKGRLLDPATGKPAPFPITRGQSLRACLRVGNAFVDRQGQLTTPTPPPPTCPAPSAPPSLEAGKSGSGAAAGGGGGGGVGGGRKGSALFLLGGGTRRSSAGGGGGGGGILARFRDSSVASTGSGGSKGGAAAGAANAGAVPPPPPLSTRTTSAATSRHLSSCADLSFGAAADDDDIPEPPTPLSAGFDGWEDQQADWSLCRPSQRAAAAATAAASAKAAASANGKFVLPPGPGKAAAAAAASVFHVVAEDDPAKWTFTTTSLAGAVGRSSPQPPQPQQPRRSSSPDKRATTPVLFSGAGQGQGHQHQQSVASAASSPSHGRASARSGAGLSEGYGLPSMPGADQVYLASVEFVVMLDYEENRYAAPLPIHAYGELVKTEAGCRYLRSSGLLDQLVAAHQAEVEERGGGGGGGGGEEGKGEKHDATTAAAASPLRHLRQRALLWALGQACSTEGGMRMVLAAAPGAVAWVVRLAETHPHLSSRGTCFCVLNLVAAGSECGRRELRRCGWKVGGSHTALPGDVQRMLRFASGGALAAAASIGSGSGSSGARIPFTQQQPQLQQQPPPPFPTPSRYSPSPSPNNTAAAAGSSAGALLGSLTVALPAVAEQQPEQEQPAAAAPPPPMALGGGGGGNSVEDEVLALIVKLSNYVTRREAQAQLMRLRRRPRYRRKFTSLRFYLRVQELVGRYGYSYRLPVRRFLTDLFGEVDLSAASWANLRERHEEQQQPQPQLQA